MNCYIFMVVLPLVSSNNQPVKIVKIWQFSIDIVGNVCVSDMFTWTWHGMVEARGSVVGRREVVGGGKILVGRRIADS